ncbi:MAG: hypothetical protein JXQ73_12575 [Phycisphaerae bacterium]|nr:hypothetical protein [Phycisphaerae bacterium]
MAGVCPVLLAIGCTDGHGHGSWGSASQKNASPSAEEGVSAGLPLAPPTSQAAASPVNLLDSPLEAVDTHDKNLLRVAVYLDLLRVEVPLGAVSRSYKVWDELDEQCLGAECVVMLKRNGFRVAVGRPEAWPPIKSFLDDLSDTVVYRDRFNLSGGASTVAISEGPDDRSVFFFRKDGTMAGSSFPASHSLFQIVHRLNPDDPSEVILKVIPEIRQNERKLEWSRRGERYVRVPVYEGRTFYELAVEVALSPGRFIVIGPGQEIELDAVVGRALLTREVEGRRYESIFVLTPRVIRSGLGER